ncbi:MAG: AMP-binding protein, partial [Candidatus Bipolaricaulota bacterium]|nr:AMP-binding protein [Candidatus Bipolaricaulota bacterium]
MLIPKERRHGRRPRLILNEISYARLGEAVARFASALNELGLQEGDRIALISNPRASWAISLFAALYCGTVVVPLDPELQQGEIERILLEADVSAAVTSGKMVKKLVKIKESSLPGLTLISMDRPQEAGVKFLDAMLLNRTPLAPTQVAPDNLAILMYTSGTTGNAKGAMLTHANISSNVLATARLVSLSSADTLLSIVPWYHIYGLTITLITPIYVGATATFSPVDRNLLQVLRKARPTIILGVPKLYNVLYTRIRQSIESSTVKRSLDRLAPQLMGRLVTRRLFGKRFRFFTSGGAPLAPEIAAGFRRMGIGIMEGYGLTETSPLLTMCPAFTSEPGMTPIEGVEVKITQPNEDGIGEVLVRGPNVMRGYYKNERATNEVIDADGWFHTGDLGSLAGKRLTLSGRAKNVIVLETGKNVYPEEVEWKLVTIPEIEEIMIYEGKRQGAPAVAAMIYPNWTLLKEQGINAPQPALELIWGKIKECDQALALFKRIKHKELVTFMDEPFQKSVKLDI